MRPILFTDEVVRSDPPTTTLTVLSDLPRQPRDGWSLVGVVDTGADRCMAPVEVMHVLGLNPSGASNWNVSVAGGGMLSVIRLECEVLVFGVVVRVEVDFGPSGTPSLVGRNAMSAATSAIGLDATHLLYSNTVGVRGSVRRFLQRFPHHYTEEGEER